MGSPPVNHVISWVVSVNYLHNVLDVNNFQDGEQINNFVMHFQTSSLNLLREYNS